MRSQGHALLARTVSKLASSCYRRPRLCLAVMALSALMALGAARTLAVDSDLISLLPESARSVQGLKAYQARGGSVGYVAVVLRGSDEARLLEYAERIEPELRALSTVDYVAHTRPTAFFEDRALYYLELEDLEDLAEQVEDRVTWERRQANPLLVDLLDEGPPPVQLDAAEAQLPPGIVHAAQSKNYYDEERGALLMLVKPKRLASDLSFAREVVAQVQGVLAAYAPKSPEVSVELGGRFSKRVASQRMLQADLRLASVTALALVLLYLGLYFRRLSGLIAALVPLMLGLCWTFGATALLFGELNILSAFVGAILIGLGIDHGLHLIERYCSLLDAGQAPEAALREAYSATGQAVVLAALTTALGFLGLAVSEFRAFREFGLICALGGGLVMMAFTLCLPALLAVLPPPRPIRSTDARPGPMDRWVRWASARPVLVLATSTALLLAVMTQVGLLRFDYDFSALDGRSAQSFALDQDIDAILGRQQASLAILTRDDAQAHEAALTLRARRRAGDGTIDFVLTSRDLVPPRQLQKQALLQGMLGEVAGLDVERLSPKDRLTVTRLQAMAAQPPFTAQDLPHAIKKELALGGGEGGGLVLVFPSVRMSDGEAILELAENLTDVPAGAGEVVTGTGEAMVLADVLRMVFQETPRALLMTVGLVFVCLLVFFRDPKAAGLAYAPAVVSVAVTVAAAAALGLKLNYLNVVFIPVLFGMAVDSGVHLVRPGRRGAPSPGHLVQTSRAVLGACLTTAAGFGTLCLAHHPGLRSLGQLALLGIGLSLAVSLIWLPALLGLFDPPQAGPDAMQARQTPPPTKVGC